MINYAVINEIVWRGTYLHSKDIAAIPVTTIPQSWIQVYAFNEAFLTRFINTLCHAFELSGICDPKHVFNKYVKLMLTWGLHLQIMDS